MTDNDNDQLWGGDGIVICYLEYWDGPMNATAAAAAAAAAATTAVAGGGG
jgi:hypothetical protein